VLRVHGSAKQHIFLQSAVLDPRLLGHVGHRALGTEVYLSVCLKLSKPPALTQEPLPLSPSQTLCLPASPSPPAGQTPGRTSHSPQAPPRPLVLLSGSGCLGWKQGAPVRGRDQVPSLLPADPSPLPCQMPPWEVEVLPAFLAKD
jgi:hypothetical protein